MKQRLTVVSVAIALCTSYVAPAAAQDRIGMMVMKFSGERDWSARCEVSKARGGTDSMERAGRGRKSSKSFTFRRITGGTCAITVPEDTTLKVDVSGGRSVVCPFAQANPCSRTFSAGEHQVIFGAVS